MTTAKKKITTSRPARTVTATAAAVAPAPATPPRATPVASKAKQKTVAKIPAAQPLAKAVTRTPAKPVLKSKAEKPVKAKKPKLVRDSFTIPKAEYAVIDELKQRAGKLAHAVKKSELIRAGIKALAAMPDAALLAALKAVPAIKTGRPNKA